MGSESMPRPTRHILTRGAAQCSQRSASLHLLAEPLDLALQPLDGRRERCRGRRRRGRRPELPLVVDEDRLGGPVTVLPLIPAMKARV